MKLILILIFSFSIFSKDLFLISTSEEFTKDLQESKLSEKLKVFEVGKIDETNLKSGNYLITFQELNDRFNLLIIYLNKDFTFKKKRQFEEIDSYYLIRSDVYMLSEIEKASQKVIETFDQLTENDNFKLDRR